MKQRNTFGATLTEKHRDVPLVEKLEEKLEARSGIAEGVTVVGDV